jgi:hypothetical protein
MNDERTAQNLMRDRSPTVVALDNLIRRKLRVSDPTDAEEIARALRQYYRDDTQAMEREAAGLPFLLTPLPAAAPAAVTSSQAEVDQAVGDVERDLVTLKTSSLLKDIEPELRGWETAIRAAVADGLNAARQGLDPRQREVAFANRRLLGDYARMARYVGALTPNMNTYYRRLSQSLDEVSGMMLVVMGESLANIGFAGGRFLLQVPLSELQARRDAVIFALRNLVGSTQEAAASDDFPRGLVAYLQILENLGDSGQSDLKVLFQENTLARLMDDLIHRAAGGTSEGLRALGATAQQTLQAFRRLIILARQSVDPESPQLARFMAALWLFLEAFENASSGYRLLFIARPPIVLYGLYGIGGPDATTLSLIKLITQRNELATHLDCYLDCICDSERIKCQVLLDKILYDLDRSIDLYLLSGEDQEEPLQRAAAAELLIFQVPDYCKDFATTEINKKTLMNILAEIKTELQHKIDVEINNTVIDNIGISTTAPVNVEAPSVTAGYTVIDLTNLTPENLGAKLDEIYKAFKDLANNINKTVTEVLQEASLTNPAVMKTLDDLEAQSNAVLEELCLQNEAEKKWHSMLGTMAPSCWQSEKLFDFITDALNGAKKKVAGDFDQCPELGVDIPPTEATSLAGRAYGRFSAGGYL